MKPIILDSPNTAFFPEGRFRVFSFGAGGYCRMCGLPIEEGGFQAVAEWGSIKTYVYLHRQCGQAYLARLKTRDMGHAREISRLFYGSMSCYVF